MTFVEIEVHRDTLKEYIKRKLAPWRYDKYQFGEFKKKELVWDIYKCEIFYY